MTKIFDFLDSLDPNLGAVYSANNLVLMTDKEYSNRLEQIHTLTTENRRLQQKVNQLENKYNKALELLVDFNLPCEQQMFMDRYSEWCELNCSVDDECYKKCWNKYIEAELEKSKSE